MNIYPGVSFFSSSYYFLKNNQMDCQDVWSLFFGVFTFSNMESCTTVTILIIYVLKRCACKRVHQKFIIKETSLNYSTFVSFQKERNHVMFQQQGGKIISTLSKDLKWEANYCKEGINKQVSSKQRSNVWKVIVSTDPWNIVSIYSIPIRIWNTWVG